MNLRFHLTQVRISPSRKTNDSEHGWRCGERWTLVIVGGGPSGTATVEHGAAASLKTWTRIPTWICCAASEAQPKDSNPVTPMFSAALFTAARKQNQTSCPSAERMWHIYTMETQSSMKMKHRWRWKYIKQGDAGLEGKWTRSSSDMDLSSQFLCVFIWK